MILLNGILSLAGRCKVKWFYKSFTSFVTAGCFFVVSTTIYAEKVCIDNGGVGYEIPRPPSSPPNIIDEPILFNQGDIGAIYDVNVELDITHPWVGDLTSRITSPNSTQITLFERPGTTAPEFTIQSSFGCGGMDIDTIFDDESSNLRIENAPCSGTTIPVYSGNHEPHNSSPNNLRAFDGENPIGNWKIYLSDSAPQADFGTLNEACVDIQYAGVTFDKWVSTNPTCSDKLDNLTVFAGEQVSYCYTVTNPGTETFTINTGDITDNQGHDLTNLEGTYPPGDSKTVNIPPLVAGTDLPVGTIINNASLTATFPTPPIPNFDGTLDTDETATLIVQSPIEISKTSMVSFDPANVTTNPKAIPGATVEYTIEVKNIGDNNLNNDSIAITDPLPANTRFFFGSPLDPITFNDGAESSGLTNTTNDISFSNDGGTTFITPNVDVSGFDITAPQINFIKIEPKGAFNANSDPAITPSFEVKFRVKVE